MAALAWLVAPMLEDRGDWVANGLLFTGYHLHVPWGMPATLVDMFILAHPAKRFRSAWIGIAVHSAQSGRQRRPRPDARRLRNIGRAEAGGSP